MIGVSKHEYTSTYPLYLVEEWLTLTPAALQTCYRVPGVAIACPGTSSCLFWPAGLILKVSHSFTGIACGYECFQDTYIFFSL